MVQCQYVFKNGSKKRTACGRVLRGAKPGEIYCFEHKKTLPKEPTPVVAAVNDDNHDNNKKSIKRKKKIVFDVDDAKPVTKPQYTLSNPPAKTVAKPPAKIINKKAKIIESEEESEKEIIKVSESEESVKESESVGIEEDILEQGEKNREKANSI